VTVDFSKLDINEEKQKTEYKNFISVKTGGEPFKVPMPPVTKPDTPELKIKENIVEISDVNKSVSPLPLSELPKAANDDFQLMIQQMQLTELARSEAQETFLRVSQGMTESITQAINIQMQLLNSDDVDLSQVSVRSETQEIKKKIECLFDREQCMEFAIGSIGNMLGSKFADIDQYPTRVRLPDEPLMLVDRILEIEGEADSLKHNSSSKGRVITEHDVLPGSWYLDQGRIPTCIAVEAGQADLFLSGYLGIDHISKGLAVYRLLDAKITFHGPLPKAGQTIHYDIQIEEFFRQDDTRLFRFNFEGTTNGQPVLTMTQGCAGFFTQQELDAGKGIVLTNIEKQQQQGIFTNDWKPLVTMEVESYNDEQLNVLRQGNLAACFGEPFKNIELRKPVSLPSGRMTLVHRILNWYRTDYWRSRYSSG